MSDQVKKQHEAIGMAPSKKSLVPTNHPEAQWFLGGGNLGLFIHYGICTVHGNVDLSWGMIKGKPWDSDPAHTITPNQYFSLARDFNPVLYNPEKWVAAIADAGFAYAVLTTRHHDGFALWPSEYGDFSTKNYMGGRDLVGEYIEACRKYGIKVGLYYSPPDWYYHRRYQTFGYNGFNKDARMKSLLGLDHEVLDSLPDMPPGFEDRYIDYVNGQIRELITRWGRIDMLWFDGSIPDPDRAMSIERIRDVQPHILVNPRLHLNSTKGATGDFETYECRLPETRPEGPWEHCHIWAQDCGWAYMEGRTYRPFSWFAEEYRRVMDWGGNFLINVGPRKDGTLQPEFYASVKQVKERIMMR